MCSRAAGIRKGTLLKQHAASVIVVLSKTKGGDPNAFRITAFFDFSVSNSTQIKHELSRHSPAAFAVRFLTVAGNVHHGLRPSAFAVRFLPVTADTRRNAGRRRERRAQCQQNPCQRYNTTQFQRGIRFHSSLSFPNSPSSQFHHATKSASRIWNNVCRNFSAAHSARLPCRIVFITSCASK